MFDLEPSVFADMQSKAKNDNKYKDGYKLPKSLKPEEALTVVRKRQPQLN